MHWTARACELSWTQAFQKMCSPPAADPKSGTPGCTKEACAFRDAYKQFEDAGAAVFGISSDSPDDNAAWAKANNLQFPLLSDTSSILRKVRVDCSGVKVLCLSTRRKLLHNVEPSGMNACVASPKVSRCRRHACAD
jgi:hypothetical protein